LTGSSLPFLVGDVGDSWSRPYQPTYERWDGGAHLNSLPR
jgi:hypothetical protein